MKKYIALFDWDKTVRRNYSFATWLQILIDKNIIDKSQKDFDESNVKDCLAGKINHDEMSRRFVKNLREHLEGVEVQSTDQVLAEYKQKDSEGIYAIMREKIFPYLVRNNIKVIIVSGGLREAIEVYKKELLIDEIYAIDFKIQDGKHTGEMVLNIGESKNKQKVIDEIKSNNPNSEILFGFGDSVSDIPILSSSKCGFINNSNRFLDNANMHYFDFSDIESGDKIIKIMSETIKMLP